MARQLLTLAQRRARKGRRHAALSATLNAGRLPVAKVKVYDLRGRTVFSTDASQIGEEKSGNAGYEAAREGTVTTELIHGDAVDGFDGVVGERELLSTYIPVRATVNGPVAAVFEIYDDITPFLERIEQTKRQVILVVASIMCLLYAALFAIVGHADRVMRRRYREREISARALKHAQNSLERRVKARTMVLARANAVLKAEIAERQLADKRVVYMAHHDALTGLPNRTLLADRVGQRSRALGAAAASSPCSSSMSTASRTSTTRSATRSATCC